MSAHAGSPAGGHAGSPAGGLAFAPAASVGDLSRLEPLARRIFGAGDRPEGWFVRKLHRECVDPELSRLAHDGDPSRPASWLGYVLVGTPPSEHPCVRTAGTGVVPEARGRGIGSQLLADAFAAARAAGFAAVRLPAAPERVPFYRRLGFRERRTELTLLTFGRGTAPPETGSHAAWAHAGEHVFSAWLPEAWLHTPSFARSELELHGVRILLSREGRAHVAMRVAWTGDRPIPDVTRALAEAPWHVETGAPFLLHALDPTHPVTTSLLEHGFSVVQRTIVLERDLTA